MIKNSIFISILILLSPFIYSDNGADKIISKNILQIYGENITIEELDRVLIYDEKNEEALIKKAKLLDEYNLSLFEVKSLLEETDLLDLKNRYHYISILYRLNLYEELIRHVLTMNIPNITNKNILYYIADSYLRLGKIQHSKAVLEIYKHQFPSDDRLYELLYLIEPNRLILSQLESSISSLIRLYSRLNDELSLYTVRILLKRELQKYSLSDLSSINGSYEILEILFEIFPKELFNGNFIMDRNSDTYTDTEFKVLNGEIIYKSIDYNYDNLLDLEVFLKNRRPYRINIQENYLVYDDYPFIDKIVLHHDLNKKTVYDLYKLGTKFVFPNLLKDVYINPDPSLLSNLNIISKSVFVDDMILEKWLYRDKNSILLLSEPNKKGSFDKCIFIKNHVTIFGFRDLDSDGVFDIHDMYKNGNKIGSAYSETGENNNITYYELYENLDNILDKGDFNWLIK